MSEKVRLDQLLVDLGLAPTRSIAQSLIMRGDVLIEDRPVTKSGVKISPESAIRIRGELPRFVGRGGEKIDPILAEIQVNLTDRVCLDIGASTGGFTDAMLQRGARKVYAVDVGTNQLAYQLREDSRVISMEQTHVNELSAESFPELPTFCVVDVSFIGVRKILPTLVKLTAAESEFLILVKPQFELEREYVEKGGVVRDPSSRQLAVQLVSDAAQLLGLHVISNHPAPITGGKKGNQEYFIFLRSVMS